MNAARFIRFRAAASTMLVQVGLLACSIVATTSPEAVAGTGSPGPDEDAVRRLVEEAQATAREGDPRAGIGLVHASRADVDDPRLRAWLDFTLGWLHQQAAQRVPPDQRLEPLEQAAQAYRAVIEAFPNHRQATKSLYDVLVEQGSVLTAVAKEPPEFWAAYKPYGDAFELRPEDERAPQRLVALYRQIPVEHAEELLDRCEQLAAAGHGPSASRGYVDLMYSCAESGHATAAEQALEAWVELAGVQESLHGRSLYALPGVDAWPHDGLAELRTTFAAETDAEFDAITWRYWGATPGRRHAIATALLALGRHAVTTGDPARGEILFRRARSLAPPFDEYNEHGPLAGQRMVTLDLASDLLALYSTHETLDVENRSEALEDELLDEKTRAYLEGDLPAIERFHTILGLVFAREDRFEDPNSLRQAPYHLQRAVNVAQARAQRDAREYQPYPRLTTILASGLAKAHPEIALEKYADAAQGYLDQNALPQATAVLHAATELAEKRQKPPPHRLPELEVILRERQRVEQLRESTDFGTVGQWQADTDRFQKIDSRFAQRQQTILLTDLRDRAYEVGVDDAATRYQEQAVKNLREAKVATRGEVERVVQNDRPRPVKPAASRMPPAAQQQRLVQINSDTVPLVVAPAWRRLAGGAGGGPFEDRPRRGERLHSVVIHAGATVHSIRVFFAHGEHVRRCARRGGDGGTAHTVKLGRGEHITGVSGRCDRLVDSITIHTNRRTLGPYGGKGGKPFSIRAPTGGVVIGLRGRSGARLDAIGLIVREASQ